MKQTTAAVIFLVLWIVVMVLFGVGRNIKADVRGGGGYEPSRVQGHPLWQE